MGRIQPAGAVRLSIYKTHQHMHTIACVHYPRQQAPEDTGVGHRRVDEGRMTNKPINYALSNTLASIISDISRPAFFENL